MALLTVKKCLSSRLACTNVCPPPPVVLCLQSSALVAEPLCDNDDPESFPRTTIDAVLILSQPQLCGDSWCYTFEYDTDLLADPDVKLLPADVVGVFCKDCQTDWVEEQVGAEIQLVDAGEGLLSLITQHGCVYTFEGTTEGVGCRVARVSTYEELIAAIGAGLNVVVCTPITLEADVTVSMGIQFLQGGSIVTNGFVFTINSELVAGSYQIFTSTLDSEVVLSESAATQLLPEWWGAVGDGTTEDTAAIDKAVFQSGATKIPVWFSKSYVVEEIELVSNCILDGTGTLIKKAGTATYAVGTTGAFAPYSNITIRNISINGNKANNTAGGCIVAGGSNLTIENCYLYNPPNACINVGYQAGSVNTRILNNRCLNAGENNGWGAIGVTGGVDTLISGNTIECTDGQSDYGIDIEPNAGVPASGIKNIIVSNNLITGGRLFVDGGNILLGTLDNVLIEGNIIDARGSRTSGFDFTDTPIALRKTSNCTIKGNTTFNIGASTTTIILSVAILNGNIQFDITDNFFVCDSPAITTYGIRFDAPANTYGRIANNLFLGLGVNPVTNAIYAFSALSGANLWVYGNRALSGVTNLLQIGDVNSHYEEPIEIGTTAARPVQSPVNIGALYLDTTMAAVGKLIYWNGTNWIDLTTLLDLNTPHNWVAQQNFAAPMGIGSTAPDRQLEINSATGACLRLTYNDPNGGAVTYTDFSVSSGGDLTIAPTGADSFLTGRLTVSGVAAGVGQGILNVVGVGSEARVYFTVNGVTKFIINHSDIFGSIGTITGGGDFILQSDGSNRITMSAAGPIGMGTTTPNANAMLDIASTTKAFMPPRMTTAQKNAIPAPTAGMMVYDSTLAKLCVYTTAWETITSV